jgi:hypothetical protein
MSSRLPCLNSVSIPLSLVLLLTAASLAQTPTTPDAPAQTSVAQNAPLNPALPTLFIVGDSTARNQADLGWGDHFAHYFDTTKINIANRAKAGRSSRSYYNEGLWAAVLAEMKPGDYVLIQMGHNDGGTAHPETDTKARASIKGIGDETVQFPLPKPFTTGPIAGQTTETIYTYGWYIRKYIADTPQQSYSPSPSATSGLTTLTGNSASSATWVSAITSTNSPPNSRFLSSTWPLSKPIVLRPSVRKKPRFSSPSITLTPVPRAPRETPNPLSLPSATPTPRSPPISNRNKKVSS